MIDRLESRRVMSVTYSNGVLVVNGTSGDDTMWLAWQAPTASGRTLAVYDGQSVTYHSWYVVGPNIFGMVSVYGGGGNDTLYAATSHTRTSGVLNPIVYDFNRTTLPTTLNGGAGNDSVAGSDGGETIYGGSSNDDLYSFGGDDIVYGEGGNDEIFGGAGDDQIYGNDGSDTLNGGTGADRVITGDGDSYVDFVDVIDGSGTDSIRLGAGDYFQKDAGDVFIP